MEEIERQYLGLEDVQPAVEDLTTSKGLTRSTTIRHSTRTTMGVRRRVVHFWPSVLLLLLIHITQNVIF